MPNSDHSNLMETIGMNDSFDSSSDDQIPMQRTSRKRSSRNYPRRRNNRVGLSSSQLFKSNYRQSLFILFKVTFVILSFASLILCLVLCYNLYNRFEILQETLDRVQSSNINTPQEMHQVHSHLQLIDTNVTQNKLSITNIFDKLTNLSTEVVTIEGKLNHILEFVQTAPDIAKLPKDVESLKTVVAGFGAKQSTDDKEIKTTSEKQAQQGLRIETMDSRIKALENNFTSIQDKTDTKFPSTIATLQAEIQKLNSVISNISNILDGLAKSQNKLDQWRLDIDDQVSGLKIASGNNDILDRKSSVKKVLEISNNTATIPDNM